MKVEKFCRDKGLESLFVLALFFAGGGCGDTAGKERLGQTEAPPKNNTERDGNSVIRATKPPLIVDDNTTLEHTFTFTNRSQRPISIQSIRKSCSCTSVNLSSDHLGPGESARLTVSAALAGRLGPQEYTCEPISSEGESWRFVLTCTLYRKIEIRDQDLQLGLVPLNSPRAGKIEISTHAAGGGEPPRLEAAVADAKGLSVAALSERVETLPDDMKRRVITLNASLGPQSTPGRQEARLVLRFDDNGSKQQLERLIVWNVKTPYSFSPSRVVAVLSPNNADRIARRVFLRRTDGQALILRSATSDNPAMVCDAALNISAKQHELMVRIDSSGLADSQTCRVRVLTDDLGAGAAEIPVTIVRTR
jgi:hypothetical protein